MAVAAPTSPAPAGVAAPQPNTGSAPTATAPPSKSKKKFLLIPVLGLVVGGVALGAVLLLRGKKEHVPEAHNGPVQEEAKPTKVVTLTPIVVNLRETRGTRYLKVAIGFETDADAVVDEIKASGTQLRDYLVDRLSSVRLEEIDTSEGRNKLKRELMTGSNDLLRTGTIKQLYFSEFVIQ